jgi:hypothetical protein
MWKFSSAKAIQDYKSIPHAISSAMGTGELLAVNGLPTSPIFSREVPSLEHEFGDHAMETGSFVSECVLAVHEFTGSLWDNIVVEFENNAAEVLPNSNIKLLMGTRETGLGFRCDINHSSKGNRDITHKYVYDSKPCKYLGDSGEKTNLRIKYTRSPFGCRHHRIADCG